MSIDDPYYVQKVKLPSPNGSTTETWAVCEGHPHWGQITWEPMEYADAVALAVRMNREVRQEREAAVRVAVGPEG